MSLSYLLTEDWFRKPQFGKGSEHGFKCEKRCFSANASRSEMVIHIYAGDQLSRQELNWELWDAFIIGEKSGCRDLVPNLFGPLFLKEKDFVILEHEKLPSLLNIDEMEPCFFSQMILCQ